MTAETKRTARLRALLKPLGYVDPGDGGEHAPFCRTLRVELEAIGTGEDDRDATMAALSRRERVVHESVGRYYGEQLEALAAANRNASHAYAILHRHARLADALHRLAFEISLEELPALLRLQIDQGEREAAFNRSLLPQKTAHLKRFRIQLPQILEAEGDSEEQRAYHAQIEATMEQEIALCRSNLAKWKVRLPALRRFRADRAYIMGRLVLFARGGYGRAELTFESDLDTGYCLDTRRIKKGEAPIFQEFIMRVESLLNGAGLNTAHQYFEISEDLSRFADPDTLHTIPSILESRPLAGNDRLLDSLKRRFYAVLPFETLVKRKMEEFEAQPAPSLTVMDLKEDFGGLRTIQIPLWIFGITQRCPYFGMGALIGLAHRKGVLSVWEATRFVAALELLYDLRNFVGAAERYYYTPEARETIVSDPEFVPGRFDDALARLYIVRRRRFRGIDELDRARLKMVTDVQEIARNLLARVLDRTVELTAGGLRVSVHLGSRRITAVGAANGARAAGARSRRRAGTTVSVLRKGTALLDLFACIAETGYDLAPGLKDDLAMAVRSAKPARGVRGLRAQSAAIGRIVAGRHAHLALQSMFEIGDPQSDDTGTLIGRYIPECDLIHFLLRDFRGTPLPVHQHMIHSLARGQRSLDWLRNNYPEWHQLLQPGHVLALKWSLFLHGVGRMDSTGDDAARSADRAADILTRLGYRDDELTARVRLLIRHHGSLVQLSNTTTYIDQTLSRYFELAERTIVNAVLLFLVNLAVVEAQGRADSSEADNLRELFHESTQILGDMRGFPTLESSLAVINTYLDNKKEELEASTRVYSLVHKALAQGIDAAVFAPLEAERPEASRRLQIAKDELAAIHREVLLGQHEEEEEARLVAKLYRNLAHHLKPEELWALTRTEEQVFGWFFTAFPNRYLLRMAAPELARQLVKFSGFGSVPVLVDVLVGTGGAVEGLLIHTRGISRSHSRVAYALALKRINILSGKVNRVEYDGGAAGYCYYFQVNTHTPEKDLHPRDFEALIRGGEPPDLTLNIRSDEESRRGTRVEFLGDDGKGYQIAQGAEGFSRRPSAFRRIRIVRRDAPFLFYKMSRVFDRYDVELRQSLITTTGNQVMDHFYLLPEEHERMMKSDFEEVLITALDAAPAVPV